jgi:hypothetical protein
LVLAIVENTDITNDDITNANTNVANPNTDINQVVDTTINDMAANKENNARMVLVNTKIPLDHLLAVCSKIERNLSINCYPNSSSKEAI